MLTPRKRSLGFLFSKLQCSFLLKPLTLWILFLLSHIICPFFYLRRWFVEIWYIVSTISTPQLFLGRAGKKKSNYILSWKIHSSGKHLIQTESMITFRHWYFIESKVTWNYVFSTPPLPNATSFIFLSIPLIRMFSSRMAGHLLRHWRKCIATTLDQFLAAGYLRNARVMSGNIPYIFPVSAKRRVTHLDGDQKNIKDLALREIRKSGSGKILGEY